jgi:glycosyltransferase involved in cell wall biosynthesis
VSIVSRSAGGAAEILGAKRIGLVCEPTGHAFAQAILHLHQNRATYNQLSKSGQEYALRFLTWQAYAQGTVEIFDAEFSKRL